MIKYLEKNKIPQCQKHNFNKTEKHFCGDGNKGTILIITSQWHVDLTQFTLHPRLFTNFH